MSVHLKAFVAILLLGNAGDPRLSLRAAFAEGRVAAAHLGRGRHARQARGRHGQLGGLLPAVLARDGAAHARRGYAWRCDDDKADVPGRLKRLADGELDFAVSTVDAYLLNGAALDFPAAIVAVLDESKGGDAILARRSKIADLEALKRNPGVRIAFTPASPSEHLLKSIGAHFDLPQLRQPRGDWRVETQGSSDALEKLKSGAADVAVLWEPDVSRALSDAAYVKLIGTDDTEKLIVDVLLASRRILKDRPDAVATVLTQYFESLNAYSGARARLHADLAESSGLPRRRSRPCWAACSGRP
jgi:ABC-type nitrate/sulfonate/bicarbonate transport system substrate-binding protein